MRRDRSSLWSSKSSPSPAGSSIRSIDRGKYSKFTVSDDSTGKRQLRQFSDFGTAKREDERIANALARSEAVATAPCATERASFGRAMELLSPTGDAVELACARYAAAVAILGNGQFLEAAARDFARRQRPSREPEALRIVADEFLNLRECQGASLERAARLVPPDWSPLAPNR